MGAVVISGAGERGSNCALIEVVFGYLIETTLQAKVVRVSQDGASRVLNDGSRRSAGQDRVAGTCSRRRPAVDGLAGMKSCRLCRAASCRPGRRAVFVALWAGRLPRTRLAAPPLRPSASCHSGQ